MIQTLPKLVISLPNRTDRLESIRKELPKLFFNPEFTIIDGVIDETPVLGVVKAHKNALRHALTLDSHVIIMEDDLKLSDNVNLISHIEQLFNNLPKEWDILTGGHYCGKLSSYNENWYRIENMCGCQFMVYNKESINKILTHDFKDIHYDRALSNCCDKIYTASKMFATQHSGYSDIRKRKVDDSHLLVNKKVL